jgi:NDP-sugar pyrophosphorylase family protein
VTDGDIRRALLEGASLEDKIIGFVKKSVVTVFLGSSRAEAIDLMQAMRISQLPVIDADGRIHGVHLLHELLGAVERPNWAVIMAGGKGTRLGELTRTTPKPMLKVAGRPILERLILHFVGFGIRRIFLSVNYLSEVIEEHFGDGAKFGCQIEYLREEEPLGTGGALSLLPEVPTHPIFVSNGDLVTQANLEEMLLFHESGAFGMTVGIYEYAHQIPYGCVEQQEGRLLAIEEKPTIVRDINAGIYVVNPPVLEMVPRRFFPITELVHLSLVGNLPVGAWQVSEEWIDIGQKDELMRARNG